MPELPEVETMVRGIRDATEGCTISAVLKCPCRYQPLDIRPSWPKIQREAKGQRIIRTARLAKRILIEIASGHAFVIEPRMTGLMVLRDPPDAEHLRIEWRLQRNGKEHRLWFWDRRGLGTLRFYSAEEREEFLGPRVIGPDALIMTADQWHSACKRTARAIKVVMLDQKCVAGIGNIYASEILHLAKISPLKPANKLSKKACERIAEMTQLVLTEAIKSEGSTLGDGTYRNALNRDGSYQNQHRVYQKHDTPCPTCGKAIIQRIVLAQRATFYCPKCQPKR